jgi:hypothetical protein
VVVPITSGTPGGGRLTIDRQLPQRAARASKVDGWRCTLAFAPPPAQPGSSTTCKETGLFARPALTCPYRGP